MKQIEYLKRMRIFSLLLFTAFFSTSGAGSIDHPGSLSIHENYDGVHNIWTITGATCYVRYTRYYYCAVVRYTSSNCGIIGAVAGLFGFDICSAYSLSVCSTEDYQNVACDDCDVSDTHNNFQMSGSFTVQKKACSDSLCTSCSGNGCLNGGDSHSLSVTCTASGYLSNGAVSGTYTVSITNAIAPTFYYSAGSSISVSHDTAGVGTVINTLVASTADDGNDYDYARYRQDGGPETSYLHATSDLFYLDTSNAQVKVGKSLTNEFSYYFTMNLCVYDRRNRDVCHDLDITLWACFQTPNCTDKTELSLHDTFGTYSGHGGGTNVIFTQTFPQPSGHFTAFSTVWHDLTWTFDSNDLPEATIDSDTGDIYITTNISIWPSWPTKDFNQVVRVSNSESCYTTNCSFFIRVHYTNWPIDIRSLPTSYTLHEDYDWEIAIHSLIVFDYNYAWEDNVTCAIIGWNPNEADMFELRQDGNYSYDSYTLYKLRCQDPDCGYKYNTNPQPWYCETDIGCLTYNRTQQYTVTITCEDGYNTSDTAVFTFNVGKNQVPVYRHLPTHIDLNKWTVSQHDKVFEIMYSDAENEDLIYEYTYVDDSTNLPTTYFLGSATGNYYDNLGNITMTIHLSNATVNETYRIHICAHERRNEICEDLTIDVEEYCSDTPYCNDASYSANSAFAVGGELFDISTLVYGGTFNGLSYSINTREGSLFAFDSATGKVTTAESFDEVFPSTTYSIIGYVYNTGACSYGQCQLTVTVTAVNYDVVITNLPETVYIHEDTTTVQTLFTLTASDANAADTYTCEIVNTNSVEPFYLDRIPPVSGDYVIQNRENGALSSATVSYTVSITCTDSHGGSDTDYLEIGVNLNQAPAFTGFGTGTNSINADPMDYSQGDTLHTVSATDTEGDDLTFTCTISASNIPFECEAGTTSVDVKISRNLRIDDDNGITYTITICLRDAKHTDQCGDLAVTFTRVKTRPEITNLPASVTFAEDTALGTTLFTPVITDPDAGETHTVSIVVTSETSTFQLDTSTGILTLGQSLDFERETSYMLTYSIRDNYLAGETEKTLKLAVTNVNEGNTISATTTSISFTEDTAANTELTDPGLSCSDIDGDTTSFAIQSGAHNSYFSLGSSSGLITLVTEWDLESTLPSTTTLVISCSDGALSSVTVITLNIDGVNDNRPNIWVVSGTSPISISPSTPLYSDLMTFEASDNDIGDDGNFEYSILGSGLGSRLFRMVAVSGTAQAKLRLKAIPSFSNDKSFAITVKVSDGESEPLFSGSTVAINYTAGDPDAKSKQTTKCLTCTQVGRTVIAVLIIEGVICAVFGIHILVRCYCIRGKVRKSRKKFDTSRNQRFKNKKGPGSRNPPRKKTDVIELENRKPDKKKESDSDSSTSSSDSSSDDDDDNRRPRPLRQDIGHNKFRPMYSSSVLPNQQSAVRLPKPMFAFRTHAPGVIMEHE